MKKQYISPVCEVVEVKMQPLLELSASNSDGDIGGGPTLGSGDEMEDIGSGSSFHTDFWGD